MHRLSFLAARALCSNAIEQCVDLVRNGPLPRPDVLDLILRFEESMVLAEQSQKSMSDTEYTSLILNIARHFAGLLDACYECRHAPHEHPRRDVAAVRAFEHPLRCELASHFATVQKGSLVRVPTQPTDDQPLGEATKPL